MTFLEFIRIGVSGQIATLKFVRRCECRGTQLESAYLEQMFLSHKLVGTLK